VEGGCKGEGGGAAKCGEGRGVGGQEKGKRGATTRVSWEKETTPQMSPDFASNGPQPFPSSTHRRSTFGQHFLEITPPLCVSTASGARTTKGEKAGASSLMMCG
jgi:hypothetical protein